MPDVQTIDGLLNLLAACNLAILGNVLDFRTYSVPNQREDEVMYPGQRLLMRKYDRNGIPSNERLAIIYARGAALSIFDWIRISFVVTGPDGNEVDDLPSKFLVQIIKALCIYKAKATLQGLKGAPNCDMASLKEQVMNVLECDNCIKELWSNTGDNCDEGLVFNSLNGYSVERKVAGAGGITGAH